MTDTVTPYMALAEAMHDVSEMCNANYDLPFSECGVREADIQDACKVIEKLRKRGWLVVRNPAGTTPLPWSYVPVDVLP
jgi:hypothetical protein